MVDASASLTSATSPRRLTERSAFRQLLVLEGKGLPSVAELREDKRRSDRLRFDIAGVHADLTRNQIGRAEIDQLVALAHECSVPRAIAAMFAGDAVNTTEARPALHMALRAQSTTEFDGHADIVLAQRRKMFAQAERIRGLPITDVVHLGTGGSLLGPRLVAEALPGDGPDLHFLGNTDPATVARLLDALNPETTFLVVASKSFTTAETMLNAEIFRDWMGADWAARTVAVSALPERAEAWGVPKTQVLEFSEWVGGRYSLWSSVSLVAAVKIGEAAFDALLAGAAEMDKHFADMPVERNLPVMMALIGIWHRNVMQVGARAVVAYADRLALIPDWLQQLEMESNGKSVMHDGKPTGCLTASVVLGGVGSDVQHSFMQQLHQGTSVVPVDFIAFMNAQSNYPTHARTLLANCIGQANALAHGRRTDCSHRDLPGNRPSNVLLMPELDAWHLGALLALYEHRTYVQSVLWGINAFDQWGVEFGKELAAGLDVALRAGQSVLELL